MMVSIVCNIVTSKFRKCCQKVGCGSVYNISAVDVYSNMKFCCQVIASIVDKMVTLDFGGYWQKVSCGTVCNIPPVICYTNVKFW